MSSSHERKPYEFPKEVRRMVWERDGGVCRNPRGCDNEAELVAHLTGVHLARILGMSMEAARHPDNAELRCWPCELEFTREERQFAAKLADQVGYRGRRKNYGGKIYSKK